MKNISLAAKYRPQTFKAVVGQDTIKKILSKSAFEGRIAPAYLLSGTRGVGKTTIARIFAKALNCENAKSRTDGEPCNQCPTCKSITQGSYIDVMEIDGASNRGIEDAKRIREAVQYAPLEGKYKIIIIDEAHMLTREAFNALLKTLEEPPSYTTFILATTEAHKFPITIVSRCQHFVFKQVSEAVLEEHIKSILTNESWQYEEEAVRLLVRRAAGSVRDAMSLLGQLLAFSENPLTAQITRTILGLAGQEILESFLKAIYENNTLDVAENVQEIMNQGVDIAYFLMEFAQVWRSFFLLKQHGMNAKAMLALSDSEAQRYIEYTKLFSLTFIHSAWQMTLDAQRRISLSLEPAVALELFLINLALLPLLLPLEELKSENVPDKLPTTPSPLRQIVNKEEEKAQVFKNVDNNLEKKKNNEIKTNIDVESPQNLDEKVEILKKQEDEVSLEVPQKKQKKIVEYQTFLDFLKAGKYSCLNTALIATKGLFYFDDSKDKLVLALDAPSSISAKNLNSPAIFKQLKESAEEYTQTQVLLEIHIQKPEKSRVAIREELEEKEFIKNLKTTFDAHIIHCESIKVDE